MPSLFLEPPISRPVTFAQPGEGLIFGFPDRDLYGLVMVTIIGLIGIAVAIWVGTIIARSTRPRSATAAVVFLHIAPMAMLIAAAAVTLPYSYYLALRLVVFCSAVLLAANPWGLSRADWWRWVLLMGAIVANPLIPTHLTREIWQALNALMATGFAVHFACVMLPWARGATGAAAPRP